MILFRWDTPFGVVVGHADNVQAARDEVMEFIQDDDPRRDMIEAAIDGPGTIMSDNFGWIAWI